MTAHEEAKEIKKLKNAIIVAKHDLKQIRKKLSKAKKEYSECLVKENYRLERIRKLKLTLENLK